MFKDEQTERMEKDISSVRDGFYLLRYLSISYARYQRHDDSCEPGIKERGDDVLEAAIWWIQ